jgi:hemolysin D
MAARHEITRLDESLAGLDAYIAKSLQPETSSVTTPPKREIAFIDRGVDDLAARVSLDRTQMQVDDKLVKLSPGMAVTVEIRTGTRQIISYLMSPLVRYKQEMLRER